MERLLRLCGFTETEVTAEGPRVKQALARLGVNAGDVDVALQRIERYYGTDLRGLLGVMGVAIRELTDTMFAGEDGKTILYASLPNAATDILSAAAFHGGGRVHAAFPDVLVLQVLGCLFNKLDGVLEAAERSFLRAGAAQCSLLQTRLGLHTLGVMPKAHVLLSMGFLCDAVCKCDEMLSELYGVPVVYIDSQQDHGREWDDIYRGVDYFAEEIRECKRRVATSSASR